ncbi:MAG: VRR-NUC domain-containing protein, partial [Gammaproteobacteria bacterium]
PLFFHPPNGGWRSKIEAAIFKGLGVRPGVPDLIVLEQNETHAGLFVELKWGKNRMTQAQIWWQEELVKRGYRHECIYSFDDFRKLIDEYLSDV